MFMITTFRQPSTTQVLRITSKKKSGQILIKSFEQTAFRQTAFGQTRKQVTNVRFLFCTPYAINKTSKQLFFQTQKRLFQDISQQSPNAQNNNGKFSSVVSIVSLVISVISVGITSKFALDARARDRVEAKKRVTSVINGFIKEAEWRESKNFDQHVLDVFNRNDHKLPLKEYAKYAVLHRSFENEEEIKKHISDDDIAEYDPNGSIKAYIQKYNFLMHPTTIVALENCLNNKIVDTARSNNNNVFFKYPKNSLLDTNYFNSLSEVIDALYNDRDSNQHI